MTVRVPLEALADSIPALRAAGVVALDCEYAHVAEKGDTIPVPPTERDPAYEDEGPETVKGEGYKSDRLAAAYRWAIESPGEPEEVYQLCAGALVGVR